MLATNALIESYSVDDLLMRTPCDFRINDGVIRVAYEDNSGKLYVYSGGLKDRYWILTAAPTRPTDPFMGGQGTLHYELDQDGRAAYVGSWWEDWRGAEGMRRISGLWIIRVGSR